MELRLAVIHWVTTVAERRGHKHELLSFQRKGIKTVGSGLCSDAVGRSGRHIPLAVVCGANLLSFPLGLLDDHLVVFLQVCPFNDSNDGADIVLGGSITTSLDASSPSFVVIEGAFLCSLLLFS